VLELENAKKNLAAVFDDGYSRWLFAAFASFEPPGALHQAA
jgi:hypothetical protein